MGETLTATQIFSYLKELKVSEDKQHSLNIAIDCLEHVLEIDSVVDEKPKPKPVSSVDGKKKAEELKSKGNTAMQEKKFEDAINYYTEAIQLEENPVFFSNRSAAYISLQNYDDGLQDALKAVEIDENFVRAYSRIGVCYFSKGDYQNAHDAYEKGLELDSGNATLQQGLEKCKEKLSVSTRDAPSLSSGGMPGGMPDLGALGGMGGLGDMLKNPQMMQMAQQMMQSNPQLAQMAQQMMGGGQGSLLFI